MHIHLDPIGGVAGDMFVAAILDAWPELSTTVQQSIHNVRLPIDWKAEIVTHNDGTLSGSRFNVIGPKDSPPSGSFNDIKNYLRRSELSNSSSERAIEIFSLLAAAESSIHGVAIEKVHFHELADWDSIADIVAAASLIEALEQRYNGVSWSTSPLPIGTGRIHTAHGTIPIPAPATVKLLEGLEVFDDGLSGERVTPTGAAILRHLTPRESPGSIELRVSHSGHGFGQRTISEISNVLRVIAFESPMPMWQYEQIAAVSFEVDDQTPEDLAIALDRIRGANGVLDVTQSSLYGKKGRMMVGVQVLCNRDKIENVIAQCFDETSTIGIRWSLVHRALLERSNICKTDDNETVQVKVVQRPSGLTAKAEISDISKIDGPRVTREHWRHQAEAYALHQSEKKK